MDENENYVPTPEDFKLADELVSQEARLEQLSMEVDDLLNEANSENNE